MKRKIVRFILGCLILLVTITLSFAAFIYLSVDNRIEIETTLPGFSNTQSVLRLDSTIVDPDSVTSFITALMEKANVHGMAISIITNHKLVYQQYFGFSEKRKNERFKPGMVFYGASLSKTIFADIVLQLAENGFLHLDTPLYKYLSRPLFTYSTNSIQQFFGANYIDYTDLTNDDRYKEITARMCLSHTSGLPNWRWLESDRKLKIKFAPGTRYSYSGEAMYLLQMVIEEITGQNYEEIAVENIFSPLNMRRSSYVWQRAYESNYCTGHDTHGNFLGIPKSNTANAAGSLSTCIEDYTTYFLNVLRQKEVRYRQLITPQVRIRSKQQFGPNAMADTDENEAISLSYGLGFGLYETPYGRAFFKEGHLEGWQHYAVGFPLRGSAIVIMSNSDNAEGIFKSLIEFCLANPYTPWYWEGFTPFEVK